MRFKSQLIIGIILMFLIPSYGQLVNEVDYESSADITVFIVKYESQADLLVFKERYESKAKENGGHWYFTDYESKADKTIYFSKYESQADLKIFYVNYESRAGWKKSSKKSLFD